MDPDLEGIVTSVEPVDCAVDVFLDNDFIDRFCEAEEERKELH